MNYTIITNFYFPSDTTDDDYTELKECIKNVAAQSPRPVGWIFIDDGSNDDSYGRAWALLTCFLHDIDAEVIGMPVKEKGNLDTIGHGWTKMQQYLPHLFPSDYIALIDFDDRFPQDYFARLIDYLEDDPKLGCVAGIYDGRVPKRATEPQGGGKLIRRSIVESIKEYWDLAPDTLFNIKSRAAGYHALSVDVPFWTTRPVSLFSESGQYRYGRRLHYRRTSLPLVLYIALRSKHTLQVLRGYWNAWRSGWRCHDPDVRRESSLRSALSRRWNER